VQKPPAGEPTFQQSRSVAGEIFGFMKSNPLTTYHHLRSQTRIHADGPGQSMARLVWKRTRSMDFDLPTAEPSGGNTTTQRRPCVRDGIWFAPTRRN